ncbi:MAG: hypothetical protein ACE5JK_04440 [Candidatus Omnitrophota bacterium]
MISKDRLLSGLYELVYVEEGMVTLYASFSKGLLKLTEGLEEDKKKEIEKMLNRLYRDSSRHKEIIDNLAKKVEESPRDEY